MFQWQKIITTAHHKEMFNQVMMLSKKIQQEFIGYIMDNRRDWSLLLSMVISSLEWTFMSSSFDESSTVTLSLDSRFTNQETDINEQNVERESAGNNER